MHDFACTQGNGVPEFTRQAALNKSMLSVVLLVKGLQDACFFRCTRLLSTRELGLPPG